MKKWNGWIVSFLCSFILLISAFPKTINAQDVSYDFTNQKIRAEIISDGSMKVKDYQSYQVDFMNGARFTLDTTGSEVTDYRVGMVDPETKEVIYFTEDYTGQNNTFQVSRQADEMEFKAYHRTENESVTFVFEYQMANIITNYLDTAVLNRKLIGSQTDEDFDASIEVILPGVVDRKENFRAWGHGAPQGTVKLETVNGRSVVKLDVPNNPANQFMEVHSVFPTALTPQNQNRVKEKKMAEIIAQEEEQVKKDAAAYKRSKLTQMVFFILSWLLAPLAVFKGYWTRHKNMKQVNPNPVHVPLHMYEVPEDITPAVMASAILRNEPNKDDFAATILDLARKGYIELEEIQREKRGLFTNGISTTVRVSPKAGAPEENLLMRHERQALRYVQPDNKPITFEEIEDRMDEDESFRKQEYSLWTHFVTYAAIKGEQIAERAVSEKTNSYMWATLAFLGSVMGFVGVCIFGMLTSSNLLLPAFLVTLACIIASILLFILLVWKPIRSVKEDTMHKQWMAFKQMLTDIGQFNMREIGELPLWEEFLVYAVSLGVADKVVDAMNIEFKPEELSQGNIVRPGMSDPYIMTYTMRHSVDSSIQRATPVQSSSGGYSGTNSGGFGGGFSGGSSGGFGGGSGSGGF